MLVTMSGGSLEFLQCLKGILDYNYSKEPQNPIPIIKALGLWGIAEVRGCRG